jgi:hypothetical protein
MDFTLLKYARSRQKTVDMNYEKVEYKRKTVYLKQPPSIINLSRKPSGSSGPWEQVTAKFVGLCGVTFDELLGSLYDTRN